MKKFIQIAGFATVLCVSGRGPVKLFKTKCFAFLFKSFVLSIDYFSYFPLSVTFPQILLKLIGKPEVKVFFVFDHTCCMYLIYSQNVTLFNVEIEVRSY